MSPLNVVLCTIAVVLSLCLAWVQLNDGAGRPSLQRSPDLSQFVVTAPDSSDRDWAGEFLSILKSHAGKVVEDSEIAWKAAGKALDGARWAEVVEAWTGSDTILSAGTRAQQRQRRSTSGVMKLVVKKEMAKPIPLESRCLWIATLLTRHGLFEDSLEALEIMRENGSKRMTDLLWSETLAEVYGRTASYDLDWKPAKSLEASCSASSSVASHCSYLHEDRAWESAFTTSVLMEGNAEVYGISEGFMTAVTAWQSNGYAVELLPSRMQRYIDRDTLLIKAKAPVIMTSFNDLLVEDKRFIIDWQIPPSDGRFQLSTSTSIVSRPMVFVTSHFFNYHHALVSILTRLVVLMHSGIFDTIPDLGILMQPHQEAFVTALLDLLPSEVTDRFVFTISPAQRYTEFYMVIWPELQDSTGSTAPYTMQHYRMPPPTAISLLRETLMPAELSTITRDTVVIYSREKYAARHTQGDQELVQEIQASLDMKYGAGTLRTVLFPLPRMDIAAQQELFSRALVVAGPHGAGLTNVLWCQPGTVVIERPTVSTFAAAIFSHLALSVDLEYAHLRRKGIHIAQNIELGAHHRGPYPQTRQLMADAVNVAVDHVIGH